MNKRQKRDIAMQRTAELKGLVVARGFELHEFAPGHIRVVGATVVDYWPATGRAWRTWSREKGGIMTPAEVIDIAAEQPPLPEDAEAHMKSIVDDRRSPPEIAPDRPNLTVSADRTLSNCPKVSQGAPETLEKPASQECLLTRNSFHANHAAGGAYKTVPNFPNSPESGTGPKNGTVTESVRERFEDPSGALIEPFEGPSKGLAPLAIKPVDSFGDADARTFWGRSP